MEGTGRIAMLPHRNLADQTPRQKDRSNQTPPDPARVEPSPTPRLDTEIWLAHVIGLSRARLLARLDEPVTPEQAKRFRAGLERLAAGEPLPYLTGRTEFYGLEFAISRATLIPRPETELLVDAALARIPGLGAGVVVVDVGTGSGSIAVALAVHRGAVRVYATDISPEALAMAARNSVRHGVAQRIDLRHGHLLAPIAAEEVTVDLIVANLPYVSDREWADLPVGVREYEPAGALRGGPDGLDLIGELLQGASAVLRPGGAILLEIGAAQGRSARALARACFRQASRIEVRRDYAGYDRMLVVEP
jgi:release factor glutamine methyltransferase